MSSNKHQRVFLFEGIPFLIALVIPQLTRFIKKLSEKGEIIRLNDNRISLLRQPYIISQSFYRVSITAFLSKQKPQIDLQMDSEVVFEIDDTFYFNLIPIKLLSLNHFFQLTSYCHVTQYPVQWKLQAKSINLSGNLAKARYISQRRLNIFSEFGR